MNALPELKFNKNRKVAENCPCGKSNKDGKFTPYVGHIDKGYCHSCGETFLPELPDTVKPNNKPFKRLTRIERPIDVIPIEIINNALERGKNLYSSNNFIRGLRNKFRFTDRQIESIISEYKIGNSKQWNGAVSFPYIDIEGNVRQLKVMDYSPTDCKRIKEPTNRIMYLGKKILDNENANLSLCFFGEHLLKKYPNKKVAIVESEKTAMIASVYFPEFVWIARGGKNGCKWLNKPIAAPLKDRGTMVYLFPDLTKESETVNAYDLWKSEVLALQMIIGSTTIEVSDLLENKATETERSQGMDLADYLNRYDRLRHGLVEINKYGYPAAWDTPSPPTVDNDQPEAEPRTDLERLQEKNPNIKGLVQRFELELI